MSESQQAGTPAFPHTTQSAITTEGSVLSVIGGGLTVRQYFAAKAMQGLDAMIAHEQQPPDHAKTTTPNA